LLQKNKAYIDGSTAIKIDYDVYQENPVLKRKKKYKTNLKIKANAVLLVLAFFAVCMLITYRYALITEMNYNYSALEARYNKIRNENSVLQVAIEKETNLSRIKELAEERLNMQTPDKFQVVYLRVPKKDVTVLAENYTPEKATGNHNSVFAALVDKVGKIAAVFY